MYETTLTHSDYLAMLPLTREERMNYLRDRGEVYMIKDEPHYFLFIPSPDKVGEPTEPRIIVMPPGGGLAFGFVEGHTRELSRSGLIHMVVDYLMATPDLLSQFNTWGRALAC